MNFWKLLKLRTPRRRTRSGSLLSGSWDLQRLENRELLSAHIASAHAGADHTLSTHGIAPHKGVDPQAYSGHWNTETVFGTGKAQISENGKTGTVSISFDANDSWSFAGNAKFTKSGVLKATILGHVPEFFEGTLKLKVKLSDASHFSGHAKVPGKGTTDFSGEKLDAQDA